MSKDEYLITDAPLESVDCFCNAYDFGQLFPTEYIIWLIQLSLVSLSVLLHLRQLEPVLRLRMYSFVWHLVPV